MKRHFEGVKFEKLAVRLNLTRQYEHVQFDYVLVLYRDVFGTEQA